MTYRIKTLEDKTGVPRNTITAWERRFGLLTPKRAPNGYRVYDEDDVRVLRRIKALQDQGYKISEAISLLRPPAAAEPEKQGSKSAEELIEPLFLSLMGFDRTTADELMRTKGPAAFEDQVLAIIMPLLRKVGKAWCDQEISISQEHFASAWSRDQLLGILSRLNPSRRAGSPVLFAGFPGDQHETGLLSAAVLVATRGFPVLYLGLDVPVSEIQQLIAQHKPSFLCVSVLQSIPDATVREYVNQVVPLLGQTRLALGGPDIERLGELPEQVLPCGRIQHLLSALEG